ncbi:MAG: hypothetical protein QOK15_361 [Nocardioidaceae bacterium]|jgi:uncharacterized RDD family membrane protein YckC|nr:hypothetical protein [Nocardioidaceae bacterium]
MSDYPPPPGAPTPPGAGDSSAAPPPPAGGSYAAPPPQPPPAAPGGYGAPPTGYGAPSGWGAPQPGATGRRPGELLDRFIARFVDLIIVGIVNAIVTTVLIVGIFNLNNTMFGFGSSFVAGAIGAVLTTVIYLGYFGYMESSQGKTVGKMIMKLHVEGPSGGKPTFEEAVKRNIWLGLPLLGVIPILGGLVAGIGELVAVIMIAVGINNDPVRRQPWTDKFAGTQVIKEG